MNCFSRTTLSRNCGYSQRFVGHILKNLRCGYRNHFVFECCALLVVIRRLNLLARYFLEQLPSDQDYSEWRWTSLSPACRKNFFNRLSLTPVNRNWIFFSQLLHLPRNLEIVLTVFRLEIVRAL